MTDVNLTVLLVEPAGFAAGAALARAPWAVERNPQRVVLSVMAAVSAMAAVAAGGSATGWIALDVVLLAALGALGVLAGSRASSTLLLLGAVAAAVAGFGSTAFPLALAASGLVLASVVLEPDPLVDGLAGGLVVQAVLRLDHPGGRGLSALVAALVLLPLMASAARTLERDHRRILLRLALGAGAFSLLGAIGGAAAAVSAVGPLRRGLSVANAAVSVTQTAELEGTASQLATAGREFGGARQRLEAWWALPARAVPVVAQHWRVLHAAALSGDELAGAGRRALAGPGLNDVHVTDGQVPLDTLAAIEPQAGAVAARVTAARRRLSSARSSWLVPPMLDKLDVELTRVAKVEKTTQVVHRALVVLPSLMGQGGPRRYFLAVQTPVESRAGGGFMGNFGEITADNGRLRLSRFGRQDDLNQVPGRDQRVLKAPEDFTARYARFRPEYTWTNVNLSPDFPTDAGVMAGLYPQSGGAPVDGVIAIDPAVLAAVLNVVGPIQVPSWPTPITAANALQTLLFDQYEAYPTSDVRVDFLGDVAQEAWRRLTTGGLPPVPQLVAALGPAIGQKHLLLASAHPDEQKLFDDMGATGRIAPVDGDFIGLVTQNAGGNKIDYFLRRSVDYRAQLDPGTGRLQATATITLRNDAPATGLPPVLIGNEVIPALPNGSNKLYLSFYTPWDLVDGRLDGKGVEFERARELGRQVYSTAVVIPPKATVTVDLKLSGRLPGDGPYRLDIYRQPVVAADDVRTTLGIDGGWRTATGATEAITSRQLESDAAVEVPLHRP